MFIKCNQNYEKNKFLTKNKTLQTAIKNKTVIKKFKTKQNKKTRKTNKQRERNILHQYTEFLGTWVLFSFIPVTVQYTSLKEAYLGPLVHIFVSYML